MDRSGRRRGEHREHHQQPGAGRPRRGEEADGAGSSAAENGGDTLGTPLDMLLSEASNSPLRRFVPGMSGIRMTAALARRPRRVVRRGVGLGAELARVGVGRSALAPAEKDRRFTEEAWQRNPLFKRTLQGYLALGEAARGLVADAELGWGDEQRMGFIVDNLVEAAAPSNNPFLNPKVLKRTLDTGGANLVEGGRRLVRDFATPPRVPSMVEADAFEVGEDLAVTPGAVVLRTDVFELIQYTPQTAKVREVPLLIVPPTINKYYVIDLAPDRSLVEHLVRGGQQVFVISWRNPDARHADWDLDTYGAGDPRGDDRLREDLAPGPDLGAGHLLRRDDLLDADGAPRRRRRARPGRVVQPDGDRARPGARGRHQRPAVAQGGRRLDPRVAGEGLPRRAGAGRGLRLAAPQRPDLELLGQQLPDGPRPQGLRHPVLERRPGADDRRRCTATSWTSRCATRSSSRAPRPCSARRSTSAPIDRDTYVVAGIADHLCKWESCYQTTQLFGGETKFVLSTSGHIAAMVNPPGNPKASYQTATDNPRRGGAPGWPARTRCAAAGGTTTSPGWTTTTASSATKPRRLGNATYEPLCDAPGTYIHDR